MEGLSYSINFTGNAAQVLAHVNKVLGDTQATAKKSTGVFGDCWKSLMAFNQVSQGLDVLKNTFIELNAPGIALNKNMAELSAITGVTGKGLDAISDAARQSAKVFGTDAAQNVESYKIILSKLDPEIAKNTTAMKAMGDSVNILSKSMGGDTVASAGVLTTAMNQYGISTKDPIEASKKMAEMMNVMAAGAQVGSAELPEIGRALENVGLIAKTTGVKFETTNAAIQILDKAGAKGAEGGVALRNILTSMVAVTPKAEEGLKKYGITAAMLADKNLSLSDKLKLLKPAMGDVAVMTNLFEKANVGAGIALIKNVDVMDSVQKAITGTNSAQNQAKIVMESYEERMKRQKAKLDDMKIGFFNATESMQPYLQGTLNVASELGKLAQGFSAVSSVISNSFTKRIGESIEKAGGFGAAIKKASGNVLAFIKNIALSGVSMVKQGLQMARTAAITIGGFVVSVISATAAQMGLNVAMSANPIGLIILGITAAVAAIAIMIKYWDEIWAAIKAFTKWIYEHSPFKFLVDVVEKIFPGFKDAMGKLWDWISKKFTDLINWFKDAWQSVKSFFGFGGDDKITAEITTKGGVDAATAALNAVDESLLKDKPTKTLNGFGSAAAEAATENTFNKKNKNASAKGESNTGNGGGGNKIGSITINKLVENITLHVTNLTEGKEKIKQHVTEALLTAVSDYTLANN